MLETRRFRSSTLSAHLSCNMYNEQRENQDEDKSIKTNLDVPPSPSPLSNQYLNLLNVPKKNIGISCKKFETLSTSISKNSKFEKFENFEINKYYNLPNIDISLVYHIIFSIVVYDVKLIQIFKK